MSDRAVLQAQVRTGRWTRCPLQEQTQKAAPNSQLSWLNTAVRPKGPGGGGNGGVSSQGSQSSLPLARRLAAHRGGEGLGAPALAEPAGPPWTQRARTGAPNHVESLTLSKYHTMFLVSAVG